MNETIDFVTVAATYCDDSTGTYMIDEDTFARLILPILHERGITLDVEGD